VLVMALTVWSQATKSLIAGCFPSDDYRHFHHGGFFNSPSQYPLDLSVTDSKREFGERSAVWIYENGTLQSIANPLPPQCDGPNCRPTPNQNHLGHALTSVDTVRIVNSWSQDVSYLPASHGQPFKTRCLNESPLIGDSPAIDRPPKFF